MARPGRDEPWTHKFGVQEDWLAQREEAVLEPSLPIIDPHHHLFLVGRPMKHFLPTYAGRRGIPGLPGKYFTEASLLVSVTCVPKVERAVWAHSVQ